MNLKSAYKSEMGQNLPIVVTV